MLFQKTFEFAEFALTRVSQRKTLVNSLSATSQVLTKLFWVNPNWLFPWDLLCFLTRFHITKWKNRFTKHSSRILSRDFPVQPQTRGKIRTFLICSRNFPLIPWLNICSKSSRRRGIFFFITQHPFGACRLQEARRHWKKCASVGVRRRNWDSFHGKLGNQTQF